MRPLIGISTYREQARWATWDVPAPLPPPPPAEPAAEGGGEPVLLPTGAVSADVVARLDGLVLAGGADVEPQRYGQAPGRGRRFCGRTGTPPSSPSCALPWSGTCRRSPSAAACNC